MNTLSQEQQKEKIREYRLTNNNSLLQEIIFANQKLIKKVADSYAIKNSNINIDDLKSAGVEGIILAVGKYDSSKNDAFLPYAKLWIKAKMQEHIKQWCSSVTISGRNGRKLFSNYFKVSSNLEHQGIIPSVQNVANYVKCSENEVNSFIGAMMPTASLFFDDTFEGGGEERLSSGSIEIELEFDKNKALKVFGQEVQGFISNLPHNERFIWERRCLNDEPTPVSQAASKIGLTKQQVVSIEKRLMRQFKKKVLESEYKDLFHSILEAANG